MWFLPFIAKHFPNFHFVYAVRDVRDLLLQHTSFTEHDVYWLKSFFGGQGKVRYPITEVLCYQHTYATSMLRDHVQGCDIDDSFCFFRRCNVH